jgi:hypothetical protein
MFEPYIQEWRALGFYCDHDTRNREYRLVGSRSGLHKFSELLRAYVADPRNEKQSEHEHYGPYGLEVMTWPEPGIDDHAIHGPLSKLADLATILENRLVHAKPGDRISIRDEFAPNAEFSLVLDVREDHFDPPSAERDVDETTG